MRMVINSFYDFNATVIGKLISLLQRGVGKKIKISEFKRRKIPVPENSQ